MSKIEVNQISSQCGSTLTIGQSGDTIQLACGATQTGFGRTGTVNWDTTAKTASFTAVSGTGYFVNTTSGAITLTLPASPSAGDIVAFKDYAFTFATNNLTVDGNGSPIGGVDGTVSPTYDTNGTSKTFIYVDGTKGWLVTNESTDTSQESTPLYITATGGTITTCGDYKIHTFTGPGTFCVSCAGNSGGSNTTDYLVVAGGGSGGNSEQEGGGGGGGFRISSGAASGCYSVSPLGSCVSALPVTVQGYPITVGAGGSVEGRGSNSIFSTIISTGGGAGAPGPLGPGGSGGGSGDNNPAGIGNTPPVSPPQGNTGGVGNQPDASDRGGGGGGAGVVGFPGVSGGPGAGGGGSYSNINPATGVADGPVGSARYYAGGGGGGAWDLGRAPGGYGGGGAGAKVAPGPASVPSEAGTTNTGGGGGGAGATGSFSASAGGSGIVIIRYKYQN